jgi:hypothetical protein
MGRAGLIVVVGFLLFCAPTSFADESSGFVGEPVRAYFLGYENNDLVFRIYNDSNLPIAVKGLSFDNQVLYRPVDKDRIVPPVSQENPYKDMIFRTTGDFVWSQNHMNMFRLAYQFSESEQRMYGGIYPSQPAEDPQKELVTEIVP